MKKLTQSRTTGNQYKSKAACAGVFGSLFVFIRLAFPELLPWGVVADVAIAGALGNLVDPLVSRFLAFRQDPTKRRRGEASATVSKLLLFLLIPALVMGGLPGCATTRHGDGTEVVSVDLETVVVFTQLALTTAEAALRMWEDFQETQDADWEVERDARSARVDELRAELERLLALTQGGENDAAE